MSPVPLTILQNDYSKYHAHVYFDEVTQQQAQELRSLISNEFPFVIGRFHTKLVGPHPNWSFQVIFNSRAFDSFIIWLEAHRDGLTILIHADTGDDYVDHTERLDWLGEPAALNLDAFS